MLEDLNGWNTLNLLYGASNDQVRRSHYSISKSGPGIKYFMCIFFAYLCSKAFSNINKAIN